MSADGAWERGDHRGVTYPRKAGFLSSLTAALLKEESGISVEYSQILFQPAWLSPLIGEACELYE